MPIGLTDYIKPKNDAFTGIVQASQVLGGGGNGTLPDACLALSNITQHEGDIDHDALMNFAVNRHIDHSGVTLIAGSGLAGGGDITASRWFALGALTNDWDAGSYKITAETLESDVATGTAPLAIASTTLVSNLNADLLDGKHVGTSGDTIPVLNAANTIDADWLFASGKELRFDAAGNLIRGDINVLTLDTLSSIRFRTTGTTRGTIAATGLDMAARCRAGALIVDAVYAGTAGTLTLTSGTLTPFGTPGLIQMALPKSGGPADRTVDMYAEVKVGTTTGWLIIFY